jgi:hypothetical protein
MALALAREFQRQWLRLYLSGAPHAASSNKGFKRLPRHAHNPGRQADAWNGAGVDQAPYVGAADLQQCRGLLDSQQ